MDVAVARSVALSKYIALSSTCISLATPVAAPRVRPREREFLRAADRGSLHPIYTRYVALHERRVALTGETSERTDDQSRTLESTDRSAD